MSEPIPTRGHRRVPAALLLSALLCLATFVPAAVAQETDGSDYDPPTPADAQRVACDVVGCEASTLPNLPDPPDLPGTPAFAIPGFVNVLIIAVLALTLAAGLFFAIRAMIRNRNGEDDTDEETGDDIEVTAGSTHRLRPKSAEDWAKLAHEAALAAEWDKALRYMHRSGILRLDEEGHVRYRRGRTNGEYALLLAAKSAHAAGTLRSLSRTVEDVQFGERSASSEMFGGAEAGWSELEQTLATPAHDTLEEVRVDQ